jgi:Tfp pilus assembly protein PilF
VELAPANLDYRTTYGILLGIDKQYEQGVAELQKVVASPGYKDADAYLNLGWLYRNMQPRRGEESVAAYRRALELDPKNEQAALGLAWAQNYLKNYDDAIKAFDQAATIDPDVAGESNVGAGWAFLFKRDVEQAKARLAKAQAAGRNDAKLAENIERFIKGEQIRQEEAERAAAAPPAPRVAVQDVGTLCQVAQGARDAGSRRRAMNELRKHEDGVPCLIRGVRDADIGVRIAAANSLGAIGPPAKAAVPHLLQAAEDRPPPNPNPTPADLQFETQFNEFRNAIRDAVRKIRG